MTSDFAFEYASGSFLGTIDANSVGEAVSLLEQRTDFRCHWGAVENGEPTDNGHAVQLLPLYCDADAVGNRSKVYGFLSWIVTE